MNATKAFLVRVFCASYVVVIAWWALPPGTLPLQKLVNSYTINLLHLVGLWQGWDMFAPNPFSLNARVRVQLTTTDGEYVQWLPPNPGPLWGLERYRRERFRKWAVDHLRLDSQTQLWQPAVEFAKSKVEAQLGVRVIAGELIRDWHEIPSPYLKFFKWNQIRSAHSFVHDPAERGLAVAQKQKPELLNYSTYRYYSTRFDEQETPK